MVLEFFWGVLHEEALVVFCNEVDSIEVPDLARAVFREASRGNSLTGLEYAFGGLKN